MAAGPTELTDHFDPDCGARGKFGDSCCTGHPVDDLQHSIRPLVNPNRGHSGGGLAEVCDLALQLVRISPRQAGRRQPDFGRIDIKPGFSLVELPADLSPSTLSALATTRISGVLIDLQPDSGGRPARGGERKPSGSSRPVRYEGKVRPQEVRITT